jgi:hypothetical protein
MESEIVLDEFIKTSPFTQNSIKFKVTKKEITFGEKKLTLSKVTELRYGMEPIQFDMFNVGRKYIIELKTSNEQLTIILKSYFTFSKKYFFDLYTRIINSIWENTGFRIINESIEQIIKGHSITIGNCTISTEGIFFNNNLTEWNNLSYQKNYDRITLNNKSNYKLWTNLYYIETNNIIILSGILDWIYQHEGLKEIQNNTF